REGRPYVPCSARYVASESVVEKESRVRNEQLGILEVRSMPGIRVENELCVPNALRQSERVDGRHHDVVAAVYHKRRMLNAFEFCIALASYQSPVLHCGELSRHRLRGAGRVNVLAA